ncbi:DUF342 domain-containing protein [Desulfovibrio psychrotolerans]|uniref:DUF342 domain-containing protein n=1 Tax=Desulfovibrio psychrotolerans TaxID=415242 RepID=A0A7J0BQD1_9BACT|nr:FapA family protein [Desulfovibrio psychrotolerans]GFM35382.1 hypothetical protein DSM19430T_00660 [Desulfovibrio psychrotolerans]
MPYQLVHHFDPNFDHMRLTPHEEAEGRVDHYNLGYVQNVVMGQVLAELVPLDKDLPAGANPAFVRQAESLPIGPNTTVNPAQPMQLVASANGYVFYHQNRITVKTLLNVRRDVDFHTGNIVFVGDVRVHGSVRSGFEVHGKNILVQKTVEGARIIAQGSITSQNGVKGGKTALLEAGSDIRLPFVENAEIRCRGNVLIDASCMHTDVWVSGKFVVRGRLQGGAVYSNSVVYVQEQLGGGIGTPTAITMGYDPFMLRRLKSVDDKISHLEASAEQLEMLCSKSAVHKQEYCTKLNTAQTKLAAFRRERVSLWETMQASPHMGSCRILVPGRIRPGVEVSIGGAYCTINDFMENVCISSRGNEIVFDTPAMKSK